MEQKLEQILNAILHSAEMLEEKMRQQSKFKNLTSRQLYCLELVKNLKNPSLSELAGKMQIAKASISVMIDRLVKNGYIFKVTSDNDRRSAHVHLTGMGEKAASLHKKVHQQIADLLTEDMTDSEKEILLVLLNKSVFSLAKVNANS